MSAPVPKPRTRYMQRRSLNRDSFNSNVSQDETETEGKKPEVNEPVLNGGSSSSPADLPEDPPVGGGDIVEKFVWPATPPESPSASDDEDFRSLSRWGKENVTSDSSTDEFPMTPLTPNSHTTNNNHPPAEHFIFSSTDRSPHDSEHTAPSKPPTEKKPNQRPKKPRAATIRVSRRKSSAAAGNVARPQENSHNAVSRSSWLDVWKSRKHTVLWTMFDGQMISLWKKRSDKFSEFVFHVSSITNVRQQDRGRFTIHFRKKHFEFMTHNEDVKVGWVTSLLASRGREPPPAPRHHGSLSLKEVRSKVYGAISGHNLWIYSSKEDFNLGIGIMLVSMNVTSVQQTGRHTFILITPYRTFTFSVDSSKDLKSWLKHLNEVILRALSCSEVAQRLWSNPWNKVCADCGRPNPEYVSINLLMVICDSCAEVHCRMGENHSKVRNLMLNDTKVWTEPLIQLFVEYGNEAGNKVWAHSVPVVDQLLTDASAEQRAAFIDAKYQRGLYRRVHPLSCSQTLLNKRLCEVVCGADVEETLLLLCSGAKVLGEDQTSAITLAENTGQALQTELLRHNEFTEIPDFDQQRQTRPQTKLEELHGRLDDERFLFSEETESAACDVLDLREVVSVFNQSTGETHEFEMLTLTDSITCTAETQELLLNHMLHIIKVVMPCPLLEAELSGIVGVACLSVREGSGLQHTEGWASIRTGKISIYPLNTHTPRTTITLHQHTHSSVCLEENTIEVTAEEKTVYLQFEREESCSKFYALLSSNRKNAGNVPPEVQRCISHITLYGLKVEGLYRCCGSVVKVAELVEKLREAPNKVVLETNEVFVQEVAGALKNFLRNSTHLIPSSERESWAKAAAHSDVTNRLLEYRRLVKLLPPDNRVLLSTLFNHLYTVQLHSQVNKMTAQNLAVVFVPMLFDVLAMNMNMVHLTRELIIHHTLIFLKRDEDPVENEMITAL